MFDRIRDWFRSLFGNDEPTPAPQPVPPVTDVTPPADTEVPPTVGPVDPAPMPPNVPEPDQPEVPGSPIVLEPGEEVPSIELDDGSVYVPPHVIRRPGSIISQVRQGGTKGPDFEPSRRGTDTEVPFPDLYGGSFGNHAQGLDAVLPGLESRGSWYYELYAADFIVRSGTASGSNGRPDIRIILEKETFFRLVIADQYGNNLTIPFYNNMRRLASFTFVNRGQDRALQVGTQDLG
jgi:hypothetical protein